MCAVPEGSQEPLQQKGLTAQRVSGGPAAGRVRAGSIWEKTEIGHLEGGSCTGQGLQ